MKGKDQLVNLLVALLFCSFFIFSSAYFGPQALGFLAKMTSHPSNEPAKAAEKQKNQSEPAEKAVLSTGSVKFDRLPEELRNGLLSSPQIVIPAQASFSVIDFARKHQLGNQDSGALSLLASAIYQAILPTNFTIDERENGTKLPAFTKLGFEAKVDLKQNLDFAFSNPNQTNYLLDIVLSNNRLTVTLKGVTLPYTYQIAPLGEENIKPKTILLYSSLLLPGQIKTAAAGENGQAVSVYKLTYQGTKIIKAELVSTDYYPPVYRVEIHSLASTQQGTSPNASATARQTTQRRETNSQNNRQQASPGQQSGTANQNASMPNRSKTESQAKQTANEKKGAGSHNTTTVADRILLDKPIEAVK